MQINWKSAFLKSLQSNQQLSFSKFMFLSYFNGHSKVEMIKFIEFDEASEGLVFAVDKREACYNDLLNNNMVELLAHFPLSKEKYVFTGNVSFVTKEDHVEKIWNNRINKEEQLQFHRKEPNQRPSSDLIDFNMQSPDSVSVNFAPYIIIPSKIEHTLMAMPSVVADYRLLESEWKPCKKDKKYAFTKADNQWSMIEINP